jgi:hypothetical protein
MDTSALTFPAFAPRAPWWGADLQTVRLFLLGRPVDFTSFRVSVLRLPLGDGSGDALAARLHVPQAPTQRPLAVLIHGLSGCEDSLYLQNTALRLLTDGYPVLRLNLRGAGRSRPLCRLHYHAGKSEDLAAVLAALPAHLRTHGVVMVGYSLGGNLLLKFLGEGGERCGLRAAVSVSAPIDLLAAAERIASRRNLVYHRYMLQRIKLERSAPPADLTEAERVAIVEARSIPEFDERVTAPRNGFASAADYYVRSSALPLLGSIRVPTLVIHAQNDPWIPAAAYLGYDWRRNPHLHPLLPKSGGHIGFEGRDSRIPWHDRCISAFLGGL